MAPRTGLDETVIREIAAARGEPDWMLDLRLEAFDQFARLSLTDRHRAMFGPQPDRAFDLRLDRRSHDVVGSPRSHDVAGPPPPSPSPAGAAAAADTEAALTRNLDELTRRGVIFCDLETAVLEHPELVRAHFGAVVPLDGNKFAALNASVWSGGSFIYVPPGVEIEHAIQTHSRIDTAGRGRFERTIIVADEGSTVHYIEGCSAPVYSPDPLHSVVAEVVVGPGARVSHTTIQNWSSNVFNVMTNGAIVEAEGHMDWIEGNIGARLTVAEPSIRLAGPRATGAVLSASYAGADQHQGTGATIIHAAAETGSIITARAVARDGGRTSHRGVVRGAGEADRGIGRWSSVVRRDALLLDVRSSARAELEIGDTPAGAVDRRDSESAVADEQLFYLLSRGLSEGQALAMVVNGFFAPVTETLPLEYGVEWSRLIELQMEDSVG